MKVIEIENLRKSFGDIKAVDGLSFSVERGQLFAFLGVNGAGKSTTISVMCGLAKKDGGTVKICGESVDCGMAAISRKIGVVFQSSVLDGALSVKDNLIYRASLYGICGRKLSVRLDELDSLLSLKELYGRTVSKLSGGQKRRVDIARALIHNPEILILDEPTTGLDPQTRKMLWCAVDNMRRDSNLTVLLTTHYMEEAADADFCVIIDKGKIVAEGTPVELKNRYAGDFITLYGIVEEDIKMLKMPYERVADGFRIAVQDTAAATELIVAHPQLFTEYEVIKGKMDDVFLAVTGKNIEGDSV